MITSSKISNFGRTVGFKKLVAATAVAALLPLSAMAGNGNNGNDNRNPNANANENRNDRGLQARNLGPLNAARANENAFLNASPNSTPGQIASYREATIATSSLIAEQNVAAQNLLGLQGLTAEEIAAQFPNGDYDAVLTQATQDYLASTEAAQLANAEREAILAALTDGRTLTDSDLAAFHEMLGL